eukprot:1373431-Rhodomonas_salina.7
MEPWFPAFTHSTIVGTDPGHTRQLQYRKSNSVCWGSGAGVRNLDPREVVMECRESLSERRMCRRRAGFEGRSSCHHSKLRTLRCPIAPEENVCGRSLFGRAV